MERAGRQCQGRWVAAGYGVLAVTSMVGIVILIQEPLTQKIWEPLPDASVAINKTPPTRQVEAPQHVGSVDRYFWEILDQGSPGHVQLPLDAFAARSSQLMGQPMVSVAPMNSVEDGISAQMH